MGNDITVAIADDHDLFRSGIKLLFRDISGIRIVLEADNGERLLNRLNDTLVDVVLLDLEMPGMTGVEACIKIRSNYPQVKIIVLTMHVDERMTSHLLELGANAYLHKNITPDLLEKAIREVVEKGDFLTQDAVEAMLNTLRKPSRKKPILGQVIEISKREKEVLELIARELTTKQIADKLFISEKTVEGHRESLLSKFQVKNSAGLILKAIKLRFIDVMKFE